ncbi:hypothetical protein OOK60_03585 [Trichothermofontia sichuanensis B231]|nr:hypothetical protein [Trichothermofontia sichuanensis]UZQ55170.1 hypothetical protein OOK60_03585 [Trichothermofontia sichuanensis B231]
MTFSSLPCLIGLSWGQRATRFAGGDAARTIAIAQRQRPLL